MARMNDIPLRQADLNLLMVFMVIMESGSTTVAADRLFLTQSAVSHSLRRLRRLFDDPLFVRSGSGLASTPRAEAIARDLEPLLQGIDRLVAGRTDFEPISAVREFKIGLPDAIGVCLVPALMQAFAEQAPKCNLILRPTSRSEVIRQLDEDEVHVAMTVMGSLKSWHERVEIGEFSYRCVFDGARIKAGRDMTLDQFLAVPHLLTSFKGDRWGVVDTALADRGLQRRVVLAAGDFASIACCLRRIDALAVMPEYAARAFAGLLGLQVSDAPLDLPPLQVSMATHARYGQDAAVRWFRELACETAQRELGA